MVYVRDGVFTSFLLYGYITKLLFPNIYSSSVKVMISLTKPSFIEHAHILLHVHNTSRSTAKFAMFSMIFHFYFNRAISKSSSTDTCAPEDAS